MKRPGLTRAIRLLKVAAAVAVLAGLYARLDFQRVAHALRQVAPAPLAAALALFAPLTLISAWRWRAWIAPVGRISLREAAAQILCCNALNLALPSKLGDVAKAGLLPGLSPTAVARATWRAGLEKAADLASLLLVLLGGVSCRLGWADLCLGLSLATGGSLLAARRSAAQRSGAGAGGATWRAAHLLATSLLLWQLHLLQLHLLVRAAGADVALSDSAARIPLAVLAGLLPFACCGIGPRDAALVWLFADLAPAPPMAAAGLLTALRYVVPGILGLPLLLRLRLAETRAAADELSTQATPATEPRRQASNRTTPATARTCVANVR